MAAGSSEALILDAWHANAQAWERAVREGRIASRKLVTDQAIVEAVLSRSPRTVIDLGCGEGWLARALARAGVQVVASMPFSRWWRRRARKVAATSA